MNNDPTYFSSETVIAPAGPIEDAFNRFVLSAVFTAVLTAGVITGHDAYEDFRAPNYEISVLDTPTQG